MILIIHFISLHLHLLFKKVTYHAYFILLRKKYSKMSEMFLNRNGTDDYYYIFLRLLSWIAVDQSQ